MANDQTAFEAILYDVSNHVATITLNRPERLNALNPAMRNELSDAVVMSGERDDVRVIVITGAGRGFCSGGDVKAMNERNESGAKTDLGETVAPARDRAVLAMRDSPVPIIAAVNGAAAGAGMNVALACDIRIASNTARFGQTFAKRGLHPDWGGTYFLPRLVGTSLASELMLTGRFLHADRALARGLISEVVPEEELEAAVKPYLEEMLATTPQGLRLTKEGLNMAIDAQSLEAAMAIENRNQLMCARTKDFQEGLSAFLEKRPPVYEDR